MRENQWTALERLGRATATLLPLLVLLAAIGCDRKSSPGSADTEAVLYTSVDEPYARPVVEAFEKKTGIHVTLLTDAEASKSVGLAQRVLAEKDHPQADVWWDNECFLAINLADQGVLAAYDSPAGRDIPARYKDPDHRWAGSVLRVRVMVSTGDTRAVHLTDLLHADMKKRIAIARPTAGTTGGHVAALYVLWGSQRADAFFHGLRDNGVSLLGGNSVVAETVARGDMRAGLCDNDDAADAASEVGKLNTIMPDQGEGEDGTLAMPCAVALVHNCPHPNAARQLIDYLLSAEVDRELLEHKFAWCSTRDAAAKGRFMNVDYRAVAREMPAAVRRATAILDGRE